MKANPLVPRRDTPCLKLQHLQRQTHKGSAADKIYHTPGRTRLISDSHSATVALNVLSQPESLFRTDDTCLLSTATCCPLCSDSYQSHIFCAQLLLNKMFSACFVSRLTGRGETSIFYEQNSYFVTSKPILSYNSTVCTPGLVQRQSRQVTVSNR